MISHARMCVSFETAHLTFGVYIHVIILRNSFCGYLTWVFTLPALLTHMSCFVLFFLFFFSFFCREEVDELAKRLKLKLFRTSVKENFNIDQGKCNK